VTPVASAALEAATSTSVLPALEMCAAVHRPTPPATTRKPCTSPPRSDHVQKVYDAVADQWHGTRYKAWPRVVEFVQSLPARSLVADLGCGNGKMAPACRGAGHFAVGCDFSIELVRIAASQLGMEAQAADCMVLPYRDAVFDAALSIAVLHHASTAARRRLLIAETLRVLRPGGRALFYAWAADQSEGVSGHAFGTPDVFVPFHQRVQLPKPGGGGGRGRGGGSGGGGGGGGGGAPAAAGGAGGGGARGADAAPDAAGSGSEPIAPPQSQDIVALEEAGGVLDPAKRAVVFQRYCHVYQEGELSALVREVPGARLLDEYYDTGNWCAVVTKL
jgi:alkylated DNA repair protein alkB family protein 8